MIDRARVLFQTGRYADAEAELREVLAEMPGHLQARALLAETLFKLKRWDDAIAEARAAVVAAPDDPLSHRTLGLMLIGHFRDVEGLEVIDRAIALAPNSAASWSIRGLGLLHLRRRDEALAAADRALAIDPSNKLAGNVRARSLAVMGRSDEAAAATAAVLQLDPNSPVAHETLAQSKLKVGDYQASRDAFRETLRLDPTSQSARSGLRATLLANHRSYRALLRYNLWYGRQSLTTHKVIAFGSLAPLYVISQLTVFSAGLHAALMALAVLVVGLVWMSSTWATLILLTDRFGRDVINRRERVEALTLLVVLVVSLGLGVWGALTGNVTALPLLALLMAGSVVVIKRFPGLRRTVAPPSSTRRL